MVLAPPILLSSVAAAQAVASEIHGLLCERNRQGLPTVLGLATGRTMIAVYDALIALLVREPRDLSRLVTFNLDEYLGLEAGDSRSFRAFMQAALFGPLAIPSERTHFPDAQLAQRHPELAGEAYTTLIAGHGGIDLQLLGIGRNGHIAFNEPGSLPHQATRVVDLEARTREDAAAEFGGLDRVPQRAITLGLLEILGARRLRLLAFGSSKAPALQRMFAGPKDSRCPASFLVDHPDLRVYADGEALGRVAR